MGYGGRFVVDVDAHYYENIRAFAKYLDEPWQTRIRNWSTEYYLPVGGMSRTTDAHLQGRTHREGMPVPRRPEDIPPVMEYLGVDVIALLPNPMLALNYVSDRRRAVALCTGFIENMLEEVARPSAGIFTTLCLPPQDIKAAVKLVEKYGQADGVCGAVFFTDGPVPFPFGDPYYDPVYEALQELNLPIVFHSGYGGPEAANQKYGLQFYAESRLAFVLNNIIHLCNFVLQGVPERFPKLRVVWEEAGIFYIPMMAYRLDMEYARLRADFPILQKPPSEYIKGFYFNQQPLEVVPDPKYFKYVFEMMDAERTLLFATDWPHQDFDHPSVIDRMTFLSEEAKRRILGENAMQALRFNGYVYASQPQVASGR